MIVTVPDRAAPLLGATTTNTVAFPTPDGWPVNVRNALLLVPAVQPQFAPSDMRARNVTVVPLAGTLAVAGLTANTHAAASWVSVTV